jgi:hypothetical protein
MYIKNQSQSFKRMRLLIGHNFREITEKSFHSRFYCIYLVPPKMKADALCAHLTLSTNNPSASCSTTIIFLLVGL